MQALGINIGYLILQILAFIILMLLLKGWAYNPILNILEERKARIAKGLEDARQAAIARDNADAEAKKILDAARAEAAKIRADANVQAQQSADSILANAREEAKRIIEAATQDAEAERNRILADLRGQVTEIAMAAASKIIGAELDTDRQHKILADFFANVPPAVAKLSGKQAVVITALPLTDEEQAAARKAIKAEDIEFKVDPAIQGGVIVRVDDKVVDESVAGKLNALRGSMA